MQKSNISNQNQKIFDFISDLILSEEFKLSQAEFFEKNNHHFQNNKDDQKQQVDENKHIFYDIYKEYTFILDNVIDSKLSLNFDEKDIQNFFQDFQDNYNSYNNPQTIEVLFSFTDFDKFKSLMLQYKQADNISKDMTTDFTKEAQNHYEQLIEKYFDLDISKWNVVQKGKNKYSNFIYTLPFEKTGIKIVRFKTVFQNLYSIKAIQEVFKDAKTMKDKKKFGIQELDIKQVSESMCYLYTSFKIPLMSLRDMIAKSTVHWNENQLVQTIVSYENHPYFENKKNTKAIRISTVKKIVATKLPSNEIQMESVEFTDLRGYFPKMFMNMMFSKSASKAMKQIEQDALAKQKQHEQEAQLLQN